MSDTKEINLNHIDVNVIKDTTNNIGGNITAGGNISAGGNITASGKTLTIGTITSLTDPLKINQNINASGKTLTIGDITSGNISASGKTLRIGDIISVNITANNDLNGKNLYIGSIDDDNPPSFGHSFAQFTGSRNNNITNLSIKTSTGDSYTYDYNGIINTGNISANGNISASGNISANGNISASNKTLTISTITTGNNNPLIISNNISASNKTLTIGTITTGNNNNSLIISNNISASGKYIKSQYLLLDRLDKISVNNGVGLIATTFKSDYYHMIFKNSYSGSGSNNSGGSYTSCKTSNASNWYKISDPESGYNPYSMTINHISLIDDNTNLNNYQIGKPIFLNNKYYNYEINSENYDEKFIKTNYNKININSNTVNSTFFNITNTPNNNFVGICSIISEEVIVKQSYNETFRKYFFSELTNEQIQEQNLDINDLPEDYIKLYKIKQSLDIFLTDFFYFDKPVIAFATHGDYMFYVNDTEALIDTNLNTQKYYEVGDELTYDGKILILPEFNPNDNLTETQQLQELINYNKQMSNYNKLKKNSIGKISHIFTQQECDDYKHYLAVFKTN